MSISKTSLFAGFACLVATLMSTTRAQVVREEGQQMVRSEPELVWVECCIPDALISEIAKCLSGPGETSEPSNCTIVPSCYAGFSATLEVGDRLYEVCAQDDPAPPQQPLHCDSWASGEPSEFECAVGHIPGHSLFVIADIDGDLDVDLRDFAALQRDISIVD